MAVLARLMLTPDQVVTMSQLVESVWDGDEPSQPQVAIRSYVSNLRRAIEPNRRRRSTESCLASSPPGYRLAIDPMAVDWVRFERLVSDGRRCVSDGDPATAIGLLRQAIELWRGCPCSGLPESPFFLAQVARLTEMKQTAIESLFEALLALGDHGSVAAEVEAAIAENPLRERLTELGMLAFYRSGRQSEALALGQRLRSRLVEDLGVDPSRSVDTLELKILNHDMSLDAQRSTAWATEEQSETDRPVSETERGLHRSASKPRLSALIESGPPIGRRTELDMLASLQAALDAGRSATAIVTGEQGIGKTHLVRSAAEQLASNGVKVAWSRSVPGETSPLWPWAQIVLSLIAVNGGNLPFKVTADLAPLIALGPSVAGSLGLTPTSTPSGHPASVAPSKATPTGRKQHQRQQETVIDLDSLSASQELTNRVDVDSGGPVEQTGGWETGDAPVGAEHRVSPDSAGVIPAGVSTEFSRAEVMLAVTSLLERVARAAPVALIFEDLQWAHEDSISLLSYAASTLADQPVGFMLTWRETDLTGGAVPSGLREFSRLPALIRIELEGLDDQAIADLADALGRPLTVEETANVHQRCDGNPLFVREVLAHTDMSVGSGRRWSKVIDAVIDRVERLPPPAGDALRAASLFRRSFSVASVAPLCLHEPELVQEAFNQAVHGGILHEVDPTAGTYRFRHSLMAEVLASRQLAVEAASMHQTIGRQMLGDLRRPGQASSALDDDVVEGLGTDGYELAFHLSKSPALEDRLLAGQVGIGLVRRRLDMARLPEIDAYVDIALTAAAQLEAVRGSGDSEVFVVDGMLYESWRAWIDGNPDGWLDGANRALARAVAALPQMREGRTASRIKGQSQPTMSAAETERRQRRVQTAVLNVIARPMLPVGPTEVGSIGFDPEGISDLLAEAVERLSPEDSAKWVAQLHFSHLQGLNRPGRSGQQKAARDAHKIVTGARKRVRADEIANVLRTYVARFAESIEPEARLSLVAEIGRLHSGDGPSLFEVRFAYSALMELGRLQEARPLIDSALARAVTERQPFPTASARLLLTRHLLWTGEFDAAECQLNAALSDWKRLGLPEPLSLARQQVAVQISLGAQSTRPVASQGWPDPASPPIGRISLAEHGLRLSRRGEVTEAIQSLDRVLEAVGVHHLGLADQAYLAVAAAELGHEKAAITATDLLSPYGDKPILRSDGSMVLGPASLFAGVAAKAAGDHKAADSLLTAATSAVQRFGGAPISVDSLICDLGWAVGSNRLPTIS